MGIERQKTPVCKWIYAVPEVLEAVLMGEWPPHDEDVFYPVVPEGNSFELSFEILRWFKI